MIERVEMPAGRYYVGDPCYTCPDEWWQEVCNSLPVYERDGRKLLGFNTQYGDGLYRDQHGNEYGVDAGLLGLVPVEWAPNADLSLIKVFEFSEPFVCTRADNGTVTFGNAVTIETDDSEEDEGECFCH